MGQKKSILPENFFASKDFFLPHFHLLSMTKIYSVQELSYLLKGTLETRFPFVWVRGQITNLSRPGSGHVYFSLKDEQASLEAVWFKGKQRDSEAFNPLTGVVFADGPKPNLALTLEPGEEILCAGQITMYPPQGRLQLLVELVQPVGQGRLQQEFERLKEKLLKLGYFEQNRKRPLPANPTRVAVITAPTGAAIHDFLRIAQGRGMGGQIRIYPSLVQGDEAPAQLVQAINQACQDHWGQDHWAELIVLIRGGGSLEDLWAFNTEEVASAIFNSPIPVITGVGHEPDVSIADLVADLRAATPSHAAQLIWFEQNIIAQQLDELEMALNKIFKQNLENFHSKLQTTTRYLSYFSPTVQLKRKQDELKQLIQKLENSWQRMLFEKQTQLQQQASALKQALPLQELSWREKSIYSLQNKLQMLANNTLNNNEAAIIPESLLLSLLNQTIMRYENKMPATNWLASLMAKKLSQAQSSLALNKTRLEALNPMQPLARGYAMLTTPDGKIIRQTSQTSLQQQVQILLADGELGATINKIIPKDI